MASAQDSQRRLVAALGYIFPPVVPIVILTSELKSDAFMRRHAGRALLWSVGLMFGFVAAIIVAIWLLRTDLLFLCLFPIVLIAPFLPGAYWGWRVYQGGDPRPPVVSQLADRMFPAR